MILYDLYVILIMNTTSGFHHAHLADQRQLSACCHSALFSPSHSSRDGRTEADHKQKPARRESSSRTHVKGLPRRNGCTEADHMQKASHRCMSNQSARGGGLSDSAGNKSAPAGRRQLTATSRCTAVLSRAHHLDIHAYCTAARKAGMYPAALLRASWRTNVRLCFMILYGFI